MPSDFASLARQQVTNLETASALSQLTEDMLVNAAFYRLITLSHLAESDRWIL